MRAESLILWHCLRDAVCDDCLMNLIDTKTQAHIKNGDDQNQHHDYHFHHYLGCCCDCHHRFYFYKTISVYIMMKTSTRNIKKDSMTWPLYVINSVVFDGRISTLRDKLARGLPGSCVFSNIYQLTTSRTRSAWTIVAGVPCSMRWYLLLRVSWNVSKLTYMHPFTS